MAFWASTDPKNAGSATPKLSYKWLAYIPGAGGIKTYTLVSFQKPTYEVHVSEYININDAFYKPGMLTWNPIEIVVIDAEAKEENNTTIVDAITKASGYTINASQWGVQSALQKTLASAALGGFIKFEQISCCASGQGRSPTVIDSWMLKHPFIAKVDYGRASYQADEIMTVNMTIRYDYATYKLGQ